MITARRFSLRELGFKILVRKLALRLLSAAGLGTKVYKPLKIGAGFFGKRLIGIAKLKLLKRIFYRFQGSGDIARRFEMAPRDFTADFDFLLIKIDILRKSLFKERACGIDIIMPIIGEAALKVLLYKSVGLFFKRSPGVLTDLRGLNWLSCRRGNNRRRQH